jgi:hypothetical protein
MTDSTFVSTDQVRQFGERATETGRALGLHAVDALEQTVNQVVGFERAAADAAPADWIKTAIGAHATLVADVNAAYVGAVRSVLS